MFELINFLFELCVVLYLVGMVLIIVLGFLFILWVSINKIREYARGTRDD